MDKLEGKMNRVEKEKRRNKNKKFNAQNPNLLKESSRIFFSKDYAIGN